MSSDAQRAYDLLRHIVSAIDRIEKYTAAGEASFITSELIKDAVIRNLEVVGEASRGIERRFPEFAEENSELPLRSAYEMRNALSHGYFKIDLAIVWRTVENDLPGVSRHGVTFEEASTVFFDDYARQFFDEDHSDGEERFLMFGLSNRSRVLMMVHCEREEHEIEPEEADTEKEIENKEKKENEPIIRIISARRATAKERAFYDGPLP